MFRKFEVLPKLARSIQLRGPPALWAEQRAAIFAEGEAAPRYRHRMSRTARGTAALLSMQGGLSASSQRSRTLYRSSVVSSRFCLVGASRVPSNFAVFLRSRDRSCEDAVVFPGIGGDGVFGHKRSFMGASSRTSPRSGSLLLSSRNATIAIGGSKKWASCHLSKSVRLILNKWWPESLKCVQIIGGGTR